MDNGDAASVASLDSVAANSRVMSLPLQLADDGGKEIFCVLCGDGCFSQSPFWDASPTDIFDGMLPWGRYMKSRRTHDFKCARDKLCKICRTVFETSPAKIKHGDVNGYLKYLAGKPEEHSSFRKRARKLVAMINDDQEPSDASLKKICKSTAKETVVEELQVGRRLVQKRTIVFMQVYDQLYADRQEFAVHFGVKTSTGLREGEAPVEGYWVCGEFNTHLPGHELFECYEDSSTSMQQNT